MLNKTAGRDIPFTELCGGDGTCGMAFWYASPEQMPGLEYTYDYLCGAKGDKSWATGSMGGLFSVL